MTERGSPADGRLQVAPARLPGPRGGRARAYLALAVVVGVIVVGLGLASLGSSDSERAAEVERPTGSLAPASPSSTSSPGAVFAWPPLPPPPTLTPARLASDVTSGSIQGSLVFLRARLDPQEQPCGQSFDVACVTAAVPGVAVPIVLSPGLVFWEAPPPGSVLVMRVKGDHLVYLGVLAPDPVSSMTELLERRPTRPFPMTLALVGGWLLTDPHGLCALDAAGSAAPDGAPCPVSPPFLADDEPLRNGTVTSKRGATVSLDADAAGLGNGTTRFVGTFLVRHALHPACDRVTSLCPAVRLGWDVVARLEGVPRYQVTVP